MPKRVVAEKHFLQGLNIAFLPHALSFHMARRENAKSLVKKDAYFLQIRTKCCFDIFLQGEFDVFVFN